MVAAVALLATSGSMAARAAGTATSSSSDRSDSSGWGRWTPGIGGQSGYDAGEFVYQDWLYDDEGAATRVPTTGMQKQWGALSKPTGSFRYPTDQARYGANAADIDQIRFRVSRRSLLVLVHLNTLLVPDSTVVTLVFGTAGSPSRPWPYAAHISTPGDVAVTAWGPAQPSATWPAPSIARSRRPAEPSR